MEEVEGAQRGLQMEGAVVVVRQGLRQQEEEGEEERQLGLQWQEEGAGVVVGECQLEEQEKKLLQLQEVNRLRVEGEGEER